MIGLEVVGDAKDCGFDDIQPSLLLDFPYGSGLEGLPRLKVAPRNREVWGMGAFPFADQDLAFGINQNDSDADVGTVAGF